MKYILTILVLICTSIVHSQVDEVLTNQTIIQLHKAGLGKNVIKSKIQSSPCNFDLSTDGLIALKKASIPDEVIAAMLTKSSVTNTVSVNQNTDNANVAQLSSGIYYFDSTANKYKECDPSVLTNQKSGGFGESVKRSITGLFNAKQRASLSGKEANLKLNTHTPIFLFVFDTAAGGFSNNNMAWSVAQSPNEFFLIKLSVVKNSREVVVGKENNVKSDVGIDDDIKISFTAKKIKKGMYEVTPAGLLKGGEYCFMFAASSMYAGQTHKVYDFSIK
jgi:hypothetical protein